MKTEAVYVGHDRVLLRAANGLKLFVDARDVSIAPHLMLDGVWEEWTDAVLRSLVKPGMRVVEVGANVGYFTLIAARAAGPQGHVHAFECDPILTQIARDNVEINGLHRTARIDARAVSDAVGTATFYATDRHRGNGTLLAALEQVDFNPSDLRTSYEVATTTLDREFAPGAISVMKIDAEGAEGAILRGATNLLDARSPLAIVMEFIPRFFERAGDDPRAVLEGLVARGFALESIDIKKRRANPTTVEALLAAESSEIVARRG